jgi:flagellar hook-length control protein FliK
VVATTAPAVVDAQAAPVAPAQPSAATGAGVAHTPVSPGANAQDPGVRTVSGVAASASATAAAAPAPTTTAPQTSVGSQLAASLRTLAGREDGVHVMTVRLHPDDLGPVRIVARLTGNDVHLHVTTSTVAAAAAVTEATPRLHEALAGGGLTATGLDVDHESDLLGQQFGQQFGHSGNASADGRDGSARARTAGVGWTGSSRAVDLPVAAPPDRHPSARSLDLHV